MMIVRAIWCVCLLGLPMAAAAKDSFRIEYFDLRGATARELRADLSRLGPVGETGIRGDGYTEYHIAWRFSMTLKDGVCSAQDVEVDLAVTMQLPRWDPPAGVSPDLLQTWDRFSDDLRKHEDGHHKIARSAAKAVKRRLKRQSDAASCEALKSRMNAAATDVLREYRGKQQEYDLETDYGRAKGTQLLQRPAMRDER
jgi:predicted secreted Zn-dependent protease